MLRISGLPVHTPIANEALITPAASLFITEPPPSPLSLVAVGNAAEQFRGRTGSNALSGWRSLLPESKAHPFFFAAHNPGTAQDEQRKMEQAYRDVASGARAVRIEIGTEMLRQVSHVAANKPVDRRQVLANQARWLDPATGTGGAYLHARDRRFSSLLASGKCPIHLMLPGYATGDRYSMILAALIEPRLHVTVAYTAGNTVEQGHAREAFDVLVGALKANGEANPASRIALVAYDGDLRAARESIDDAAVREHFRHVDGFASPLGGDASGEHVFHISLSTELLRRQFTDLTNDARAQKYRQFQDSVSAMVAPADRVRIDKLVDRVMREQSIRHGDVGLWIADRQNPSAREAEAIARPGMFEQIAARIEQDGGRVYNLADTYINPVKAPDGNTVLVNRHKYRPVTRPHLGRFWSARDRGELILAARENQWYFMDRLLTKTEAPLVGIRSGALEPLALMGHPVIYLEHAQMFTPERHASWQGHLPYHRMITDHTTGYMDNQTEVTRATLTATMVARILQRDRPGDYKSRDPELQSLQEQAVSIEHDIAQGVLADAELDLLASMVLQPRPALAAATQLWPELNAATHATR